MLNQNTPKAAARRTALSLIATFWLGQLSHASANETNAGASPTGNPDPDQIWCQKQKDENALLQKFGGAMFANPSEISSRDGVLRYHLIVDYSNNIVDGCQATLRSYNYQLVGQTLRAKPGDTLKIKLINNLPISASEKHPQQPPPNQHSGQFSFNVTNLHTHGLHVSPRNKGDNVFIEIPPQDEEDYEIKIPENHVAGTFWYHAHLHGATAIQVSSGMAGALIISSDQGLDAVPEIRAAKDQVLMVQQFVVDKHGRLEDFDKSFPSGDLNPSQTLHETINGQLFPTIKMRPGEIQRWRLVHAGIQENIVLALDGHVLHEIAADGIPLGRLVQWTADQPLLLAPGYRSDVLVKAAPLPNGETHHEYFLRDLRAAPQFSLQAESKARALATSLGLSRSDPVFNRKLSESVELTEFLAKPPQIIARVVVEGDPVDMKLPADLSSVAPSGDLRDIKDDELKGEVQKISFQRDQRVCYPSGECDNQTCQVGTPQCSSHYMIDGKIFVPSPKRFLEVGKASKWILTKDGLEPHIFHIHTNPFQVKRREPDGQDHTVWKDTILVNNSQLVELRSRYPDFWGNIVLHCHILGHEDVGMMQSVELKRE